MKIKSPSRANFSRSAKLCDQNLYHVSTPNYEEPINYQHPCKKQGKKQERNYFFKSVSREKRGNFRFDIKETKGEFTYYPDFNYLKSKSPKWVIPKTEKYENEKYQQYELCKKHPLIKQNEMAKMKATGSMKDFFKDKVKMSKSNSMMSTQANFDKNYSIIDARNTSPSGFFNQSKIKTARFLEKKDLCHVQSHQDNKTYERRLSLSQRGFVDFKRQKQRKNNVVRKSFEYFTKSYDHQKQFSNYSMVKYPKSPQNHIDFEKHLDRPDFYDSSRLGPNPQILNIDFCRKKDSNINYKLSSFRDKIKTRYDRVGPQPNTRLDIDIASPQTSGMVLMEKVIGRTQDLFPIIDPIIKKAGDRQMKEQLKKNTFRFQVNEAHKLVNPDVQINKMLG